MAIFRFETNQELFDPIPQFVEWIPENGETIDDLAQNVGLIIQEYLIISGDIGGPIETIREKLAQLRTELVESGHKVEVDTPN